MKIEKLKKGDLIGIICPSHIGSAEKYGHIIKILESLGYQVKMGANAYKDTHGYLASETERADDFNNMVSDKDVKMIFFGGGEGGNETLPYLDYENIKRYPKLYCSYSDGTSILNAIHAMTGLTVYYGQTPGDFEDLRHYTYTQFLTHFNVDYKKTNTVEFIKNSDWLIIKHSGICKGTLIGGYTRNFAMILGNMYFKYNKKNKYILFLEDHEKFSEVATVSSYLSHIEQHEFINNVSGLIFGHYSKNVPDALIKRLERFGEKYNIPVVYCDDFGHGVNHAILPIGETAELNTNNQSLVFC